MKDLTNKAMLVELTINQWGGQRTDKTVSAQVAQMHNVNERVGRYRKSLVDPRVLAPVKHQAGLIRAYHHKMTLPWSDRGARLLPVASYYDYMQNMQDLRLEFERLREVLIYEFEGHLLAARQDLGSMFNEADYPDASTLSDKFGVDMRVTPIPNADDFRVSLSGSEVEALREQVRAAVNEQTKMAVLDVYHRAGAVIDAFVDRLSDEDNKFKNSLVENARSLVAIMPSLNFTDDPQLTALCQGMEDALCRFEPDVLRSAGSARSETLERAQQLKAQMENFFGTAI